MIETNISELIDSKTLEFIKQLLIIQYKDYIGKLQCCLVANSKVRKKFIKQKDNYSNSNCYDYDSIYIEFVNKISDVRKKYEQIIGKDGFLKFAYLDNNKLIEKIVNSIVFYYVIMFLLLNEVKFIYNEKLFEVVDNIAMNIIEQDLINKVFKSDRIITKVFEGIFENIMDEYNKEFVKLKSNNIDDILLVRTLNKTIVSSYRRYFHDSSDRVLVVRDFISNNHIYYHVYNMLMLLSENLVSDELILSIINHDIGKFFIDFLILESNRRLFNFEKFYVNQHSLYSAIIAYMLFNNLRIVYDVLFHHEYLYDGGYYNIDKKFIDERLNLISVLDVIEALMSLRKYKDYIPLDFVITNIISEFLREFEYKNDKYKIVNNMLLNKLNRLSLFANGTSVQLPMSLSIEYLVDTDSLNIKLFLEQ